VGVAAEGFQSGMAQVFSKWSGSAATDCATYVGNMVGSVRDEQQSLLTFGIVTASLIIIAGAVWLSLVCFSMVLTSAACRLLCGPVRAAAVSELAFDNECTGGCDTNPPDPARMGTTTCGHRTRRRSDRRPVVTEDRSGEGGPAE
jgi:hypothetical protein